MVYGLSIGVSTLMAASAAAPGGAVLACLPFMPWAEAGEAAAPERLRVLAHLVNGAALAQVATAMPGSPFERL